MANPFCYVELHTGDTKASRKFYKSLFDWKYEEMSMGGPVPYTMINMGKTKGAGGGINAKSMPEAPTMWLPYVEVASVKKTLAKAAKGGAKVVQDYMSIGAHGALGVFIDPAGAAIGVWEAAAKPAKKVAKKKPAKKAAAKKK